MAVLPTSAPQYGCTPSEAMRTDVTFSPGPQSLRRGGALKLPTLEYRRPLVLLKAYVSAFVLSAK